MSHSAEEPHVGSGGGPAAASGAYEDHWRRHGGGIISGEIFLFSLPFAKAPTSSCLAMHVYKSSRASLVPLARVVAPAGVRSAAPASLRSEEAEGTGRVRSKSEKQRPPSCECRLRWVLQRQWGALTS